MKKNEKATLAIKLTRNQFNDCLRSLCKLSCEDVEQITNKTWNMLIKEPINIDYDTISSKHAPEDHVDIVKANLAIYAFNSQPEFKTFIDSCCGPATEPAEPESPEPEFTPKAVCILF